MGMSRAPNAMRRIHVTGAPGSGKTRAAGILASRLGLPLFDLDRISRDAYSALSSPVDPAEFHRRMAAEAQAITRQDAWLTEGCYFGWADSLYSSGNLIVCMQTSWRVASFRVLWRHVRTSLLYGHNPYPGWGRLFEFWRWCSAVYADRNAHGLNEWGTPNTLSTIDEFLAPYRDRVVVCRDDDDIERLIANLEAEPAWR